MVLHQCMGADNHIDFASSQRIYLSYAEAGENGTAGTAVAYGTLSGDTLADVKVIYRQEPKLEGPNHFGSRIVFDDAGHLFISQGDRNNRPTAQELDKLQGKLVRLNLDGSVPQDNPFVGKAGARPEIWSYGHRNMQGMALDPRTGKLWQSEHGPRGGDEINLPQAGKNYGWPVITHGINYSGQPIPEAEGKAKDGMEQPFHVWEKSPGVSGMAFYTGRPESPWNDSVFLGSLAERNLILEGVDAQAVIVKDTDGTVLMDLPHGGFITVIQSGMERARKVAQVPGNPPMRVVRYDNGRLVAEDPATGWSAELYAFGQDNKAAFERLLTDKK